MLFARIVLGLGALMYGLLGLLFLFVPKRLEEKLGLRYDSPAAITEIRAFYGGLELGLAVFLVYCIAQPAALRPGLWALVLVALGSALGRAFGLVMDGKSESFTVTYLIFEVLTGLLGLAALMLSRGQSL